MKFEWQQKFFNENPFNLYEKVKKLIQIEWNLIELSFISIKMTEKTILFHTSLNHPLFFHFSLPHFWTTLGDKVKIQNKKLIPERLIQTT